MSRLAVLFVLAFALRAGTVQGVVVENASGRTLARTVVRLDPVAKSGGTARPMNTRTGLTGSFTFPTVSPGIYILSSTRDGYFPTAYGQRLPIGHGTPLEVTEDSKLFTELRMRHMGAITGRVLDENGVGAVGVQVVCYQARLPLRTAGHAITDDRGVYRIHGLEPGRYWVRSAAQKLEDSSGWLPTFGPQVRESHDARMHAATVDTDTTDADISPDPGTLFSLGGTITCGASDLKPPPPIIVTLSSETGRRETQTTCAESYRFDNLAPAAYEVLATQQGVPYAGFTELYLDHDSDAVNIQVLAFPDLRFETLRSDHKGLLNLPLHVTARRQDLSETDTPREITTSPVTLPPGHWGMRARVAVGQYVDNILNNGVPPRRKVESSDWFEVFIPSRSSNDVWILVSNQTGQIKGTVKWRDQTGPGVPVFLWPVAEAARRSLGGPRQVLTDAKGEFQFGSLPAGDYRLLASFDINEIDEEVLELSRAITVHADVSQAATTELQVWVAP
jgi:hypothetical protein